MKRLLTFTYALSLLLRIPLEGQDQSFYYGNDLSYVNQMEDCGAVYKEDGQPKDPFVIFADHETNLVRVRLWKDPSWWQGPLDQPEGVKSYYNDFEDVKKTIRRAKENGMEVMLGIHYSDFWADPGHQLIPRSWIDVAHDLDALKDSVYNYTIQILTELDAEGLMPNIVKVGNENNGGILTHIPEANGWEPVETVSTDWSRHAQLFNTAIKAVRYVGATASINPKIALHMTNGLDAIAWNYENRFFAYGVTDFDILGFSYYYAWHGGSIDQLEATVQDLVNDFPEYDVMALETGYPWTNQNFDQLGNIVTDGDPEYLPLSPERQLEYMIDYTRAVKSGGGMGVVFWEPAWVTTPCRTPWGIGSSHDHLAFFDPENTNFMDNGGGRWTESQWYDDNQVKVSFKVDMYGQDVSQGVYLMGDFLIEPVQMLQVNEDIYYHYEFMEIGTSSSYFFLNGHDLSNSEAVPSDCSGENGQRRLEVGSEDITIDYQWSSCEAGDPDRHLFHDITFRVDLTGNDKGEGAFITGSFTGDPWQILPMRKVEHQLYEYTTTLKEGRSGAFHFLNRNDETGRELVPKSCAPWWGTDRGYEVESSDRIYSFAYGSCDESLVLGLNTGNDFCIYPNPSQGDFMINSTAPIRQVFVYDLAGLLIQKLSPMTQNESTYHIKTGLPPGLYVVRVETSDSYDQSTLRIY